MKFTELTIVLDDASNTRNQVLAKAAKAVGEFAVTCAKAGETANMQVRINDALGTRFSNDERLLIMNAALQYLAQELANTNRSTTTSGSFTGTVAKEKKAKKNDYSFFGA